MVDEHRLPASPAATIAMLKKEHKSRVFLRVDEYMRLLHAAAGHSRDYAILQLFLQTGIAVEELTRPLSPTLLRRGERAEGSKGRKGKQKDPEKGQRST